MCRLQEPSFTDWKIQMARGSPLKIEGTSVSYIDKDKNGRPTKALVRAMDNEGRWKGKRFTVTSWKHNGDPHLPNGAKDWAKADAIRDELLAKRIEVLDLPDGVEWRVKLTAE